jgi:DNA (cytosine-5)-methyltransferase 1
MREHKVMIRVSDGEKQLLDAQAKNAGLMTASWARMELLRSVREAGVPSLPMLPPLKHPHALLSLFCGPGGLDEGFRLAEFATVVAFDKDEDCVRTFAFNHRSARCAVGDITTLAPKDIDRLAGGKFAPVGVIGGPPCQSFSVSNVHQSEDDPRHSLPMAYAALLKRLNRRHPISFFVFENVPGLLGKKHATRYSQFKKAFESAGFEIYEKLLNAQDFGVPQDRPRIIIVGINKQKHPGKVWTPPAPSGPPRTVRDVIADLPEPVPNERGLDSDEFPVHPNHWCLVPRSGKFAKGMVEGEMWGRSFRTLKWDEPSWTVAYGHREVHVHPRGHRRLSIYEAMLLQSFPPSYRLLGNMTAQVRLVSEAVPPKMAYHIACSVKASLGL